KRSFPPRSPRRSRGGGARSWERSGPRPTLLQRADGTIQPCWDDQPCSTCPSSTPRFAAIVPLRASRHGSRNARREFPELRALVRRFLSDLGIICSPRDARGADFATQTACRTVRCI